MDTMGQPDAPARPEIVKVEAASRLAWPGSTAEIYSYLSNLRNLLSVTPGLQRLQITKYSGQARLQIGVPVPLLGQALRVVVDVKAIFEPEQDRIIVASGPVLQTGLFGPCPPGFTPASFYSETTLKPGRLDETQVAIQLRLGLQELPNGLGAFSNSFFVGVAQTIAQEQIKGITAKLNSRLQQGYNSSRAV